MARKNNGEPKTFAYEEFMARARKEGRVRNEELSMKVLKPDLSLQARVNHIDVDHVRALHDILKNGQPLAPIIVFEIDGPKGKTFKIADGFHRYEVYKRDGRLGIPCIVVTGTLQEAIEYAASANQTLSLKRSREDIRKAVWLLLDNGWLHKSSPQIAKQVGTSQPTVDKHRAAYCTTKGISVPATIVDIDGTVRRKRKLIGEPPKLVVDNLGGGKQKYRTSIGRKTIYIGQNISRSEAEARLQKLVHEHRGDGETAQFTSMLQSCASRGVGLLATSSLTDTALSFVKGHRLPGIAVTVWEDGRPGDLLRAIGSVVLIAAHFSLPRMIVIKKQAEHSFDGLVSVAEKAGVEFMTLDEFVAAVKAEQSAGTAVAR